MSGEIARQCLRILVLDSLPNGEGGFRFDRKVEALQARLAPHVDAGSVELIVAPATSFERLQELLDEHWVDILHIVAHAESQSEKVPRALLFEDRRGHRRVITSSELAKLFASLGAHAPDLVVLEVCRSLPIAHELRTSNWGDEASGIVAMAFNVAPELGKNFFAGLYHNLAGGLPLREACTEARRDLELLAPHTTETPVLVCGNHARGFQVVTGSRRSMRARAVHRCRNLAPLAKETFGRIVDVGHLNRCWFDGRTRLLVLQGERGIGKTHVVRSWLDTLARRGWLGASRVFTWSFTGTGPGCSDVYAFVEEALEFFGDRSYLCDKRPIHAARARGLRLGRILRRESFLLILDGVVSLTCAPHCEDEPQYVESRFHPVLAAVLSEIRTASSGLCVITTSDAVDEDCTLRVTLEGLDAEAARKFLWHHGLVDEDRKLDVVAKECGGNPLALTLISSAYKTADSAIEAFESCACTCFVERALEATGGLRLDGAACMMARLLLARGKLTGGKVDGPALARALHAKGIVRVHRAPYAVEVAHPALVEPLFRIGLPCPEEMLALANSTPMLFEKPDNSKTGEFETMLERADAVRLAMRCGAPEEAVKIFVRDMLRLDPEKEQWSYISRELGATAEELMTLACLLDVSIGWDKLAPSIEHSNIDDSTRATIFHRAGLCLRHLGRLHAAVKPLERAQSSYAAMDSRIVNSDERAAICGNDLAETYLRCDMLTLARATIVVATGFADASSHRTAKVICHATRGYVHHLLNEDKLAAENFANAANLALEYPIPAPCSRPGYMKLTYDLDRLERLGEDAAVSKIIAGLTTHLKHAKKFDEGSHVATVSIWLTTLAEGRLYSICARRGWSLPGCRTRASARTEALVSLNRAIQGFRENQHIWMLPEALLERARLRRLVEPRDLFNAQLDIADARRLALEVGMPRLVTACDEEIEEMKRQLGTRE